jgi:hypothetical protein
VTIRPFYVTLGVSDFSTLGGVEAVAAVVGAIILTLLLSYATYRLVEQPSRRWLRSHFATASNRLFPNSVRTKINDDFARLRVSLVAAMIFLAACAYYQFVVVRWIAPHLH